MCAWIQMITTIMVYSVCNVCPTVGTPNTHTLENSIGTTIAVVAVYFHSFIHLFVWCLVLKVIKRKFHGNRCHSFRSQSISFCLFIWRQSAAVKCRAGCMHSNTSSRMNVKLGNWISLCVCPHDDVSQILLTSCSWWDDEQARVRTLALTFSFNQSYHHNDLERMEPLDDGTKRGFYLCSNWVKRQPYLATAWVECATNSWVRHPTKKFCASIGRLTREKKHGMCTKTTKYKINDVRAKWPNAARTEWERNKKKKKKNGRRRRWNIHLLSISFGKHFLLFTSFVVGLDLHCAFPK